MVNRLRHPMTAILITLVLVLLSILIGASLSLHNLRDQAFSIYMDGGDNGWGGIQDDLWEISWNSQEMLALAHNYLSADEDVVLAVSQQAETLERISDSPEKAYQAAANLLSAVERLDARLRTEPLDSDDEVLRSELTADIAASEHRLTQSTYNEAAEKFNDALTNFPANILSALVGVEPLEFYALPPAA